MDEMNKLGEKLKHKYRNKLSSAKDWLDNSCYYKEAWRMWMVADWRLKWLGQVQQDDI